MKCHKYEIMKYKFLDLQSLSELVKNTNIVEEFSGYTEASCTTQ